jgi:hypothetical protein
MRHISYGVAVIGFLQLQYAQAAQPMNSIVRVSLPFQATVFLKTGGSTTGKVMSFDAKKQQIALGNSSIQLTKVDKVVFDRTSLTYRSNGKIVIRGEDTAKAEQQTWQNLPLSAFRVKDSKLGQAEVNLGGVLRQNEVRGIQSVALNSDYVVDEIQFQPAGKMMIKVTPSDR